MTELDPARRRFLQQAGALSGALVIALNLPGCSRPEESSRTAAMLSNPEAPVAPNAWLSIGTDGRVTLLVDRSEMGQGVYTALPMLLAEELEVDLDDVNVEFAPAGDAYVNTLLGTQVTGGSTSVREGWDKLRRAGAEARMRLVSAAAQHFEVDAAACRAERGAVVGPDGQRVAYGELATVAAALPAPDPIELKQPDAFKVIGKSRNRLDTPSKVDGSAVYGIDVQRPDMLYAALAQAPVLGGALEDFNADAALKMPGVRNVIATSAGVAVVADSWWQARQARDAVEIRWAPGANAQLDNATITKGLESVAGEAGAVVRSEGDTEGALKSAATKLEAVYELPLLAHATLEPQNCTVEFVDGECHVHAPTQVQLMAQGAAAKAAGLDASQVHVHTTMLGGGFGRRLEVDFIPAAVEVAKAIGKPVKLLWTREDDTTHDAYRPPARDLVAGGLDADGKLIAWKFHIVSPSVTSRWAPAVVEQMTDPFAVEAAANYPYAVPNVHVDFLQHEIGITVGYLRSVSHALNCFVAESFMDELAHAAKRDPFEFRRDLLEAQPRWRNVLELAAGKAGWGQGADGRHQGIALMEGYGTYIAQVAEVSVGADNRLRVHRIVCAVDCGRMVNPSIVEAQATSGIVFGLTAALWGDITLKGGQVEQQNFDTYRLMRMSEMPELEVHLVDSTEAPGGMGEPTTALVAPAVANAIFAATGKRLRSLPFSRHGLKV
jgi:isoquinoline 1-oxidoreductase beta subunit